jgi:cell division septum initiation protein DivIVA
VVRYADELAEHIVKKDRTQLLDEFAVEFLKNRRRESPIVLMTMDKSEENEQLKKEVESLKAQLMTAQNELLKSKDEILKAQERIIDLQNEAAKNIEDRAKYAALLEDNQAKEEALKAAAVREAELQRLCDQAQTEARSYHKTFFGLYKKDSVDISEK